MRGQRSQIVQSSIVAASGVAFEDCCSVLDGAELDEQPGIWSYSRLDNRYGRSQRVSARRARGHGTGLVVGRSYAEPNKPDSSRDFNRLAFECRLERWPWRDGGVVEPVCRACGRENQTNPRESLNINWLSLKGSGFQPENTLSRSTATGPHPSAGAPSAGCRR